jgi:hypothetical protein
LQFNSAYSRQLHIQYKAIDVRPLWKSEERFRAWKGIDRETGGPQKASKRFPQFIIVINDCYNPDSLEFLIQVDHPAARQHQSELEADYGTCHPRTILL